MEVYNVTISNDEMKDKYKVSVHNDKEKSILEYKEKDETLTAFDYLNNILKRNNNEMSLEFKFTKGEITNNKIFIKELNKEIEVEILTKEILKDDKFIKIVYVMNDVLFEYTLEKE